MRQEADTPSNIKRPSAPGESGVTPTIGVGAWQRLFDAEGACRGRTWFRPDHKAALVLPRLSNAQMPDQEFFAVVGRLLESRTHPARILLPPAVIGPGELRAIRQTDLHEWTEGGGHPAGSVEVPFSVLERRLRRERDHGPAAANPDYWVRVAVRIIDGLTVADFCRETTNRERYYEANLRRQLRNVQRRLAVGGVLPWAAFDDGAVPRAWKESSAVDVALEQWYTEAAAIDEMGRVIDGLVAGLAAFERTNSSAQAEAVLLAHLRS